MTEAKNDPLFLVSQDGKMTFMSLHQAGYAMNSMWSRVNLLEYVLYPETMVVRHITEQDRRAIQRIADEADADK